jgi:hypothetical protein
MGVVAGIVAAVSAIGSQVQGNQIAQKQKGAAAAAQRQAQADADKLIAQAPNAYADAQAAANAAHTASVIASRRTAQGRPATIATSPLGIPVPPPTAPKTLLGV